MRVLVLRQRRKPLDRRHLSIYNASAAATEALREFTWPLCGHFSFCQTFIDFGQQVDIKRTIKIKFFSITFYSCFENAQMKDLLEQFFANFTVSNYCI